MDSASRLELHRAQLPEVICRVRQRQSVRNAEPKRWIGVGSYDRKARRQAVASAEQAAVSCARVRARSSRSGQAPGARAPRRRSVMSNTTLALSFRMFKHGQLLREDKLTQG